MLVVCLAMAGAPIRPGCVVQRYRQQVGNAARAGSLAKVGQPPRGQWLADAAGQFGRLRDNGRFSTYRRLWLGQMLGGIADPDLQLTTLTRYVEEIAPMRLVIRGRERLTRSKRLRRLGQLRSFSMATTSTQPPCSD